MHKNQLFIKIEIFESDRLLETAVTYYIKTLPVQPDHSRAYNNLGIIYFRTGKADRALEILQQGLKILPSDMELNYNLAIILNRLF